MVELL